MEKAIMKIHIDMEVAVEVNVNPYSENWEQEEAEATGKLKEMVIDLSKQDFTINGWSVKKI